MSAKPPRRARNRAPAAAVVPIYKQAGDHSNAANKDAMRRIRAFVVGDAPVSKALTTAPGAAPNPSQVGGEDPLSSLLSRGLTIEPPFDLLTLATLPENNSELQQCIEAMGTNIEATGHRFVPRLQLKKTDDGNEPTQELKNASLAENVRLQNFFMYATQESFPEFRSKLRTDKETTGNCYFEVVRDNQGSVQTFTHIPSYQVRLGRLDDDPRLVNRKILELQVDGSVKVATVKEWRRFRRYVQSRFISSQGLRSTVQGHKVRWFKEFGDPQEYFADTGDPIPAAEVASTPVERKATEVIHQRLYSPRSPYGMPRFIGNLLSIFGDRAAEEINYVTFRNNNIPSMAVLVSNGQLTEGTIERIESFVESQVQGSDNYSKFLIIEGEPISDEGDDGGQFKVEIKPLTADQHKDALFQNYSSNNQDKVRRAFRLPPIFVGRSEDYTQSTAESSRRLADEQIFAPERMIFDEMMNRLIFPEMGIVYHKYKSNTPNTTDNAQLVKILAGSEKTGGMTPAISRAIMEDILGQPVPGFPEWFPADVPFSLTMAEAVKNLAPEPAEPGQSVTAIKILKSLLEDDEEAGAEAEDESMSRAAALVLALNRKVEKLWRESTQTS
jgi:PBSX family phage portal protein